MPATNKYKQELRESGFVLIENVFSENEINLIINTIEQANTIKANFKRRVIHIEFSDRVLPEPLQWSELENV